MISLKEYLKEDDSVYPELEELGVALTKAFNSEFPHAVMVAQVRKDVFSGRRYQLYVSFTFVPMVNNRENERTKDPVYHAFTIDYRNGVFTAVINSARLGTTLTKNTGFRKLKGDRSKIVKGFSKFFSELKVRVRQAEETFPNRSDYPDKYLKV